MTTKYKSLLNWSIKLCIFILATVFIFKKLVDNKNLVSFQHIVQGLDKTHVIWILTTVFLLMLLNWVTEAYKWRMQLKDIAPISLWTALQSVFCGLTVGVITPNRIGDYGARVFFLSPGRRAYGLVALGTGAFAQFILITLSAAIAICTFLYQFKGANTSIIIALATVLAVYTAVLCLLYFNMGIIKTLIDKIKFLARYQHFFDALSGYKKIFLVKILLICLFRLCLLIVQYYLIVHLLIPELSFFKITLMVTLIISVQTILPTIEILDIGVRGATSIYFFSFITHQDISILATSSLIWFINLMVPAIIGLCFVHKLKLFGQT